MNKEILIISLIRHLRKENVILALISSNLEYLNLLLFDITGPECCSESKESSLLTFMNWPTVTVTVTVTGPAPNLPNPPYTTFSYVDLLN